MSRCHAAVAPKRSSTVTWSCKEIGGRSIELWGVYTLRYASQWSTALSTLDLIGRTPIVELVNLWKGPGRILAKAEFLQPGGSVKDRAARAIVDAARDDGRLKPRAPVIEMTSGNMGSGLAVVCACLGHPLVVTMSDGNSPQRVRMLEALGAEVVL